MERPTLAIGLMSGCFGCLMSLLELGPELVELFEAVELRRTPLNDAKAIEDVTIGILEGALSTDEDLELARQFRDHSQYLVSLGTCPTYGGIGGLRNFHQAEKLQEEVYLNAPGTVDGRVPSSDEIPKLLPRVRPLSDVVKVDIAIPGCPPPKEMIRDSLMFLLKGTEITPRRKNLCVECPKTKKGILTPQRGFLTERVNALMELDEIELETCLIEQGVLCLGPVTVEGCGARCPSFNVPCRGCLGPTEQLHDQGAKLIDAVATLIPAGALMFMEDVVGAGYRFSLPFSETLKEANNEKVDD